MGAETRVITWRRLDKLKPSTPRGALVASAGVVMAFNIVSKLLGFTRDIVIAAFYGAARVTDAFLVAQSLSMTFIGTVGNALGTSVLPVVTELRVRGKRDEVRVVASTVLNLALGISAALGLLGALLAGPFTRLAATGLSPEAMALAARLARVLFVAYILVGAGTVLGLLLNSLKEFAIPALNPVILNIATIAGIAWLARGLGIYAVAYGFAAGALVQFGLQALWLRRGGLPPGLAFDLGHPAVRRVLALAIPVLAGSIIGGLYTLVDNRLASHLPEGSISAKTYGLKLVMLPVGILVAGVSTVIFPTLSERAAKRDQAGLADMIAFGIRTVGLITIPAAVGLAVLRVPIVRVLFQRGAWDERASLMTAAVVLYYALGIFALTVGPVPARAFQGMQDMVTPLAVGAAQAAVNIALDLALVGRLGLVGLAVANVLASYLGLGVYYYLLNRRVHGIPHARLAVSLLKILAASAFMALVVSLAVPLGDRLVPSTRLAVEAGKLLALIALGGLVYLGGLIALRLDEVRSFGALLSRLARRGGETRRV